MNYLRVLIVAIMTYLGISNHVLRNKVNELDEELEKMIEELDNI